MITSKNMNTHITTAEKLAKAQPWIMRALASGLWIISYLGNVLMFGGQVITWAAAGVAIAWQIVVTLVQWIFCNNYKSPLYLAALMGSVAPSIIGYAPRAQEIAGIGAKTGSVKIVCVYGILLFFLIAADVIPERTFIKR